MDINERWEVNERDLDHVRLDDWDLVNDVLDAIRINCYDHLGHGDLEGVLFEDPAHRKSDKQMYGDMTG